MFRMLITLEVALDEHKHRTKVHRGIIGQIFDLFKGKYVTL